VIWLVVGWIVLAAVALALLAWELGPWFKVSDPPGDGEAISAEENARPHGNVTVLDRRERSAR